MWILFVSTSVLGQSKDDKPKIYAPNSFTPNNDGVNDVFFITTDSISDATLIIYNRAGTNIYNSSNLWWTGDSGSGFYCENGIYTWLLRYKDINGFYNEKRGYVQLTR
jgi:gliding motility-associated-like protein